MATIQNTFDGGSNECIVCVTNLANIRLSPCGHRQLCEQCYNFLRTRATRANPMRCPSCREIVTGFSVCHLQLRENPVSNVFDHVVTLPGDERVLNIGYLNPANQQLIHLRAANADQLRNTLRGMIQEVDAGRISAAEIREFLADQPISANQIALIWAELARDHDVHRIVAEHFAAETRLSELRGLADTMAGRARQIVRHIFLVNDLPAYVARGVGATAVDLSLTLATTGTAGLSAASTLSTAAVIGVDALTSVGVCIILCSLEVILWGTGAISGETMVQNCKEHASGCAGSVAGAVVGGTVGALGGPVGAIVGSIVGGLIGTIIGRIAYRYAANQRAQRAAESAEAAYQDEVRRLGLLMGIDVDIVPYRIAKRLFRERVHVCHPDKFSTASPQVQEAKTIEAAQIIAAWRVVREYYEQKGEMNPEDEEERESFLKVWVVKVKEAGSDVWKVVRSFFEPVENASQDPNVRVDQVTVYF